MARLLKREHILYLAYDPGDGDHFVKTYWPGLLIVFFFSLISIFSDVQMLTGSRKMLVFCKESILECEILFLVDQTEEAWKRQQTMASTCSGWWGCWAAVCSGSAGASLASFTPAYVVDVLQYLFRHAWRDRGEGLGTDVVLKMNSNDQEYLDYNERQTTTRIGEYNS